ncbi:DUF4259 domain-containing protein [Corynebacterium qintianiae]|uniref:DUF4259 domain-containing protein n=1 Tax=Corynebacterium qintianiae TaxID=2709392 RepID=A0A7T0PER9_9CORY|nr:DUF4259 domain-containing protein [Corynebacterium qintianiae]QPK84118.1 DUF4259 domain-containing protein [Corynebacterium qintianiae]
MGTWNWGPFDNDIAFDAVRQLADGTFRMDQFRFDCEQSRLDTEQLQVLVALAAVVNGYVPAQFESARAYEFGFKDRRWIEARVREAVAPTGSELYDMWKDAGELEQWLAATNKVVR